MNTLSVVKGPPPPIVKVPRARGWREWFIHETDTLHTPAIEHSPHYRRTWTKESPLNFALVYFKHHLVLQGSDPPQITFNEMHMALCRAAKRWMQPKPWREAWVAPRGVGKSSWCYLILPLWALAHGHREYAMFFSYNAKMAERQLSTLRRELSTNKLLIQDYPELAPQKVRGGQNTSMTVIANGGTIAAAGLFENTLGAKSMAARPDLIICHQLGTPMLHDGQWIPVEGHPSYRGPRADEGCEVSVWGLPFSEIVTPEHRYWAKWAKPSPQPGKFRDSEWVEARDLDGFHYIGTPIDMVEESAPPWLENVKVDGLGRDAAGRVYGSHWESQPVRPDRLDDPEFWWLIGYWWGNGHVGSPRDEGPNYATVAVTIPDSRPDLVERLRDAVTAKVGVTPRAGCTQYKWSDAPLARWLRTWKEPGAGQAEKAPPVWVERLPLHLQRALVEGYTNADGDETSDVEVRVSSIYLPGLLMLRRIQARLGVTVTVRRGPAPRLETFPDGRQSWSKQKYDARWSLRQGRYSITRTHIADGMLWSKVRSVTKVPVAEFAPIKTPDSTYITAFGLSHNCDDIQKLESVITEKERDRIVTALTSSVFPMAAPHAAVGLFGTTTSYGSPMHEVALHARGRRHIDWVADNGITPRLFPGVILDPDTGQERSLWPERWPLTETHLGENRRRSVDGKVPRTFELNYLLDPSPFGEDGATLFREELIRYKQSAELGGIFEHAMYIDTAPTAKRTSDRNAIIIVGRHPARRYAVIEFAWADQITAKRLREIIRNLHARNPTMRTLIVETVQGSDLWRQMLDPDDDPLPAGLTYRAESWLRGDKVARVKQVLDYYEQGKVFHAKKFIELEREMVLFPNDRIPDDLVDSLTGALRWAFDVKM